MGHKYEQSQQNHGDLSEHEIQQIESRFERQHADAPDFQVEPQYDDQKEKEMLYSAWKW